jgi:hypothetical protein
MLARNGSLRLSPETRTKISSPVKIPSQLRLTESASGAMWKSLELISSTLDTSCDWCNFYLFLVITSFYFCFMLLSVMKEKQKATFKLKLSSED